MIDDIFSLLISLLFLTTITYVIGLFFSFILKINNQAIFTNFSVGLVGIVVFISLYKTSLNSINIIFLFVAGLFVFQRRKQSFKSINYSFEIKGLLKVLFVSTLVFGYHFFEIYNFKSLSEIQPVHWDFISYFQNSLSLNSSGNENTLGLVNNFYSDMFSYSTPYHYMEIWLNVFFVSVLKINGLKCLLFITYTILNSTCVLGIISLLDLILNEKLNFIIAFVFAFILSFLEPIYFAFYENYEILNYNDGICNTSFFGHGKKYSTLYIFSIFFVRTFIKNKKYTSLNFIPLISIGSFGGVYFFYVIKVIKDKLRNKKVRLAYLIIPAFIIIFYFLNNLQIPEKHKETTSIYLLDLILNNEINFAKLKLIIFNFIFPLFRTILFLSPFVIIIIFLNRKKEPREFKLLLVGLLILIGGSITAAIFYGISNNSQFLYNCIPIFNEIMIYYIIGIFNANKKKLAAVVIVIILFFNIFNNFNFYKKMSDYNDFYYVSNNFSKKAINYLDSTDKLSSYNIGYLYKEKKEINMLSERGNNPAIYLNYCNSNPAIVCLNKAIFSKEASVNHQSKNFSAAYVFEKENNSYSLEKMIHKFNIKIIISEGKNKELKGLNFKEVFKDEESDFYLLEYTN